MTVLATHILGQEGKHKMALQSTQKRNWVLVKWMLEVPLCAHLIILVASEDGRKSSRLSFAAIYIFGVSLVGLTKCSFSLFNSSIFFFPFSNIV